jgi:regulator of replication initiation timing
MMPLPSYSQIVELIKKGATIEAQEQIMKLREAALELQEENLTLREENKRLREEKELATNLEFEGGLYWLRKDNNRTGSFCAACYDEHHRLSRLHDGRNYIGGSRWICVVCSRPYIE